MSRKHRIQDVWPFLLPKKTPGYGISREFYVSVLAAVAQLPAPRDVVRPKPEPGIVQGFIAPLSPGSTKDHLSQPMMRGGYAVASPDKRSVLRLLIMPTNEAGYVPDAFLSTPVGQSLSKEITDRVRATWYLLQVSFEAHDPAVWPSMKFLIDVTRSLAERTDGVIADPIAERYALPSDWTCSPVEHLVANEHMDVKCLSRQGRLYSYTRGLRKFALPEFEMDGLRVDQESSARRFLLALCQTVLLGNLTEPGSLVGEAGSTLRVADGGLDRSMWEGIPCLELIPEACSTSLAVDAWADKHPPTTTS